MKASNCLTRCLWHWNKYGGVICYDGNHATVIRSEREYIDIYDLNGYTDALGYGIDYFLSAHKDFLNNEEIEILTKYFENKVRG